MLAVHPLWHLSLVFLSSSLSFGSLLLAHRSALRRFALGALRFASFRLPSFFAYTDSVALYTFSLMTYDPLLAPHAREPALSLAFGRPALDFDAISQSSLLLPKYSCVPYLSNLLTEYTSSTRASRTAPRFAPDSRQTTQHSTTISVPSDHVGSSSSLSYHGGLRARSTESTPRRACREGARTYFVRGHAG